MDELNPGSGRNGKPEIGAGTPEARFQEELGINGKTLRFSGSIVGPVDIAADISGSTETWACYSSTFQVTDVGAGTVYSGELFILGFSRTPKVSMVRIHSACLTGDIFDSLRCDCGPQLKMAAGRIIAHGDGYIFYMLDHEGRGIGIHQKLKAYGLQQMGFDTYEANRMLGFPDDLRNFDIAPFILSRVFGKSRIRLMTNNPKKVASFDGYQMDISREEIYQPPQEHNVRYLTSKRKKGHLLPIIKVLKTQ